MNAYKHFGRAAAGAIALIAFLPTPSMSEPIPAPCSNERNQAAMTRCADELLKQANAEMGKTLKELLDATDKENQKYVTEAQEAWKAYADKECISRIGGSPKRVRSWTMPISIRFVAHDFGSMPLEVISRRS